MVVSSNGALVESSDRQESKGGRVQAPCRRMVEWSNRHASMVEWGYIGCLNRQLLSNANGMVWLSRPIGESWYF